MEISFVQSIVKLNGAKGMIRMFGKDYHFILEIWENKDTILGTRHIMVKEFSEIGAVTKAWIEANVSLTTNYLYCLKFS